MKSLVILLVTAISSLVIIGGDGYRFGRGYHGHHFDQSSTSDDSDEQGGGPKRYMDASWWQNFKNQREIDPSSRRPQYGFGYHTGGGGWSGERGEGIIQQYKPRPNHAMSIGRRPWIPSGSYNKPKPVGVLSSEPTSTPTPSLLNVEIEMLACIRSCPVTLEYSPVCGSNNVTYSNPGGLECEQKCGVAVTVSKMTACSVPAPIASARKPINREDLVACIRKCPYSDDFSPVCGSNNITYENAARLTCEKNCGVPVEQVKPSPCVPEVVTTEITLTKEEQIASCMRTCPVTGEYNPVCGSDNVTYTNPGRLECAQSCGAEIQLSRRTSCNAIADEGENDRATTNNTELNTIQTTSTTTRPYINGNGGNNFTWGNGGNSGSTDAVIDGNNSIGLNGNKDNSGNDSHAVTGENNDVKGDGLNVENDEEDVNKFNNSIIGNVEENGSNQNEENSLDGVTDKNDGTIDTSTDSENCHGHNCNNEHSESLKKVMTCMQLCSLTSEYNPVCGSDGITYTNPGRLLCSQFCGIDVKVKKFAPCESQSMTNIKCVTQNNPCVGQPLYDCSTTFTNPPVTVTPVTNPTPTPTCMEACTASNVYEPVCGSNNVTYTNKEVLQCARRCGINVVLESESECTLKPSTVDPLAWNDKNKPRTPAEIQECINHCAVEEKYEPICGSNGVTYNNTGHLICARQCGVDVQVKSVSPCPESSDVTPKPNDDQATTPQNGLNFTISQELLDSIWSKATESSVAPVAVVSSDEDVDLDERFQGQ